MELLIIILNKEEHVEKILEMLVELGVSGATIINSEGLGHFLAYEIPIFAGLRQMVGEKKSPTKTILSLIDDKEFIPKFKELLDEEKIDFAQPDTGLIITLPVNTAIKSKEKLA